MVATVELIKQIIKINGDFNNSRENYVNTHPDFLSQDIRLMVYDRFLAVLDMALIQEMFRTFQLPVKSWWTSLPEEFARNGISPVIKWEPNEADRAKIIGAFDGQCIFVLYMLLFATLENVARQIVRVVHQTESKDGRGDISKIYHLLLSTNYSKYESALELFRLARNTSHNNGVYFPLKLEITVRLHSKVKIITLRTVS